MIEHVFEPPRDPPSTAPIADHVVHYPQRRGPQNVAIWPLCGGCGRDFGVFNGGASVSMVRHHSGILVWRLDCHCGASNVLHDLFVRWPEGMRGRPRDSCTEQDHPLDGPVHGRYIVQENRRPGVPRWVERYEPCPCGADLAEHGERRQVGVLADDPGVVVRQVACRQCSSTVLLMRLHGIRGVDKQWISGGP